MPGKVLSALDPDALDRLAERLPLGSALISATNGKTTTAAMAAEILSPRLCASLTMHRAQISSPGSPPPSSPPGTRSWGSSKSTRPLCRRWRAVSGLGRSASETSFETSSTATGSSSTSPSAGGQRFAELSPEALLVVNGDDPQVGDLSRERPGGSSSGSTIRGTHRPELQHAADSKWCLSCGHPYEYAAAYVGHLGDYRCPACGHGRPPLDVSARDVELGGLESVEFTLVAPAGECRVRLGVPGLYNVYNALAAASLALALGAGLDDVQAGLRRFGAAFGRFERIEVGERSLLVLLVKNPAGANEVVRTLVTGGAPKLAVLALNDAIADGRDVSWIWDVDWEPLLAGLDRVVVTGERAAEMALRCKYAGFPPEAIEVVPELDRALDRGLELTAEDGELVVLPTYTAMLALRKIVSERGFVRPYWERAA